MKPRLLLVVAVVMGAALLPRGAAAQPAIGGEDLAWFGYLDDVAVDPAANRVYVAFTSLTPGALGRGLRVIDGATNAVVATVAVGASPERVAVNPTTSRVYVSNPGSNSVSVVDGTANRFLGTVPVGLGAVDVAVNPATNRVYVIDGLNTVSVIDGAINTVVATVYVDSYTVGVAVNPASNLIYVAKTDGVSVIDGTTNTVVAIVPVGLWPLGVAVNPATNLVYVAKTDGVSVIDGVTNTVVATVPLGRRPTDVAVNPTTNHVYVTGYGNVAVIDGATNSVVATTPLRVAGGPAEARAVAANPVTNLVYVATTLYAMETVLSEVKVIVDSPSVAPPPAPPPAGATEAVSLEGNACNAVSTTYPDGTSIATIAGAVTPPGIVESLWEFQGGVWMAWSPAFPAASDLTEADFLDVVSICVVGSATFTRPVA